MRQTMRALLRSYCDISIFTRSPTVRRTKRLRILPEMVAKHLMLVVQFDAKHRPGQHGLNTTFDFYVFFHEFN
jgi:hypothetical protein